MSLSLVDFQRRGKLGRARICELMKKKRSLIVEIHIHRTIVQIFGKNRDKLFNINVILIFLPRKITRAFVCHVFYNQSSLSLSERIISL